MPKELMTLLFLVAGESMEWYVARLLSDTSALYRMRPGREHVERWLRSQGLV